MKRIQAIIRPFMLEDVKSELTAIGIEGITVTECQEGPCLVYTGLGLEQVVGYKPATELILVVPDEMKDRVIDAIVAAAEYKHLRKFRSGKIFVTKVERVIRIRTGEENELAL